MRTKNDLFGEWGLKKRVHQNCSRYHKNPQALRDHVALKSIQKMFIQLFKRDSDPHLAVMNGCTNSGDLYREEKREKKWKEKKKKGEE